jgi:hypothetical protein
MKRALGWLAVGLLAAAGLTSSLATAEEAKTAPSEAAVERTRRQVKVLDTVYKNVIVLITDKYVLSEDDFAAGSAAVLLFERITDTGFHKVRLLDATGEPYDSDNVAQDEFEKNGVKQLKSGKDYVEKVVQKDGQSYLRAMTPVPVVMQRCTMCHANYLDVPKGHPIGAISYTLPIK